MDALYNAASIFKELLDVEYVFVLGRKNVKTTIHLIFHDTNFYHLAGLQHLEDIAHLRRNKREIFKKILNKQIGIEDIKKSRFYKDIEGRVTALSLFFKKKINKSTNTEEILFRHKNFKG